MHNFGTCAWRTHAQWQNPKKKTCFDAGKIGFCHCAWVLQAQVPKLCTDLDLSLLYILILGTCSKFDCKINFLALGVYCPAGQSAFRRSRKQLKLGEEIDSSRLVHDDACKNQRYQTPPEALIFIRNNCGSPATIKQSEIT